MGTAQPRLDGTGNHLLQRRIGDEERRDDAGMRRIGAAQLQGRRRAVGFGIAGIGRQAGGDLVGAADNRVEPRVGILAVQRSADLILQIDIGDIEAAAASERERAGDVERVERIKPAVLIGGPKRDRTNRNRTAGLAEKYS